MAFGQPAQEFAADDQAFATISSLTPGAHTVAAITFDMAGNTSDISPTLDLVVDIDAPTEPVWNVTEPAPGADGVSLTGQTEALPRSTSIAV